MATLTVQDISRSGIVPSAASAATSGDAFANDGLTFVDLVSTTTALQTATFNSRVNCNQGFDHDVVVGIANQTKRVGPFPTSRFNNAQAQVTITYSGVVGLTVAAFKVPRS